MLSALVSAVVAALGWLTAHGLTLRAQRKALQNQVLNGAREAVVRGIRRYQDWLSDVIGFSERLGWAFDAEQSGTSQDWKRIAEEAMDLFYKRADVMVELIYVLEEYEIVFPATRDVRNYLQSNQRKVVIPAFGTKMAGILEPQNRATALKRNWREELGESAALSEYLRVWVQNASLGKLLGRKQPVPEPTVPGLPRLEMRAGMLRVVPSDERSAERGRKTQG